MQAAPPLQSCIQPDADSFPLELAALLDRPAAGAEEISWEAFLNRYSRLLLSVAFDFGRGYDEAMDRYAFLLDELRRNSYRRLRGFKAVGNARFTTWLVVVTRRLCIDHYRVCYGRTRKAATSRSASRVVRRRLREPVRAQDDIASLPDGRLVDASEALVDAERGRAIGRALEKLPPGDLKLLELRFRDDLPAREIAEALAMPTPFHVYRRLRSVCGALRADLEHAGVEQGGGR